MKSIIALEVIGQLRSGLMDKNHEEGTERQIEKAFEVAGGVVRCGAVLPCIGLHYIALHYCWSSPLIPHYIPQFP